MALAGTENIVFERRNNRAGQVYASPLLAEDRIYYLTRDGKVFVAAANPKFQQLATNDLDDGTQFNGSFAVDESRLLVRSDKYLYSIGE